MRNHRRRLLVALLIGSVVGLLSGGAAPAAEKFRLEMDVDCLGADRKEKCDLYPSAKVAPGERRPGIGRIHGGGWSGGDKAATRERNIGTTLAQRGYVCLSINYVLARVGGTEVLWPRNLHDCKTAVRWLRKNAGHLQLDPDRIGAIGGSAGWHLTAMVALTGESDGLDPTGPYSEFSCRVVLDFFDRHLRAATTAGEQTK